MNLGALSPEAYRVFRLTLSRADVLERERTFATAPASDLPRHDTWLVSARRLGSITEATGRRLSRVLTERRRSLHVPFDPSPTSEVLP